MLKLVSPRPYAARRKPRRRKNVSDGAPVLYQQIEDDRAAGQTTQRIVAGGRRTIVEVHCCLQRAVSRTARSETPPVPAEEGVRRMSELTCQLDTIHQRLLLFSSSVELEIDRLDMICAEVEQLIARAAGEKTS
jgi:hypothetical protein